MPRNSLRDLNDHLFAEMERLGDEDLTPDQLEAETRRARAMVGVAEQIVAAGTLVLRANMFEDARLDADSHLPRQLTGGY